MAPITGKFVPWNGGCLFISRSGGVVPTHAHYSIQVAFGSTPGIAFSAGEDAAWVEYDGAVIPSRQPHSMRVPPQGESAVIFVEPETAEGRVLAERWLQGGIAAIPSGLLAAPREHLFATWRAGGSREAITAAAWDAIRALTGGVQPAVASDPRILRAIAYINAHLAEHPTLEDVAAEACLSPGRFRHLFVEQTGMAMRPYILWRRFLRAWELIAAGENLSGAAHGAGFADAAHLTRTSRRAFGLAPSAMLMTAAEPGVSAPDDAMKRVPDPLPQRATRA